MEKPVCFVIVLNDGTTWSNLDGCRIVGLSVDQQGELVANSKSLDGNYDNPAKGFKDLKLNSDNLDLRVIHMENCNQPVGNALTDGVDFHNVRHVHMGVDGATIRVSNVND